MVPRYFLSDLLSLWRQIMGDKARVKQFTNLYSMGLLPKIEGRYLSGPKPVSKVRLGVIKRSDFSMENAKARLNKQLKKIELSQRIMERSQRNINRSICRTENVEPVSPMGRLSTVHIKSIDIATPQRISQVKKPINLMKKSSPSNRRDKQIMSQSIHVSKMCSVQRSSNSPSVVKAKFGKKPIQQEKIRQSPQGQTIGEWASTMHAQKTQNHFQIYSEQKFNDDRICEYQQKGLTLHHIAIKKIQRSRRQLLFKSTKFTQNDEK